MAKKKTKSSASKSSRKSHGQLFDSHPNLIWLLPIFLIIAAVAVVVYNNSLNPASVGNLPDADQIPAVIESTGSAETPDF